MSSESLRHREFNPLKVLHHFPRLESLSRGQDVAPVTVELDPVAYCNHRCEWCVDPVHKPNVTMPIDTFRRVLSELREFELGGFRVKGIVFKGGGEPTLHPDFDTMVVEASEAGFEVGVVTNGSVLDRNYSVLAEHSAYVRVSLDGPTPESHHLIHQSKDFERILRGVELLLAARNKRHPIVGASFAMDIRTVDLAPRSILLGEALKLDYVLLRPPFFEEVGALPTMDAAQARHTRDQLRRAAEVYAGPLEVLVGGWIGDSENHGGPTRVDAESGRRALQRADVPIEHRTRRCLASPVLAVITADCDVYGCCNLRAIGEWSFGRLDYAIGSTFRAIYSGPRRAEVLARMHRTECLRHCTHPLSRYNEIIETLRAPEEHSGFV